MNPAPDRNRGGPPAESSGHPVIAIDGGAGTGKTTSASIVASRLGFAYIDSGALYRAIALALQGAGVTDAGDPAVSASVARLPLRIQLAAGSFRVMLSGRELGLEIRTPGISNLASKLAVRSEVRARVREILRQAARHGSLVVEGRDIGTVVFPDAVLKVFLTADLAERARRRRLDLLRQGVDQTEEEVARDLAERDRRDSTRADSPLAMAPGALVVDTSRIGVEDQVRLILEGYARTRAAGGA